MTTPRPSLFLIDASNVFFRGYAAAPELTAPDGFPTGGLHSFFQMLHSIEKKYAPDHMLLVFDKGKSFRSTVFEEYKAHRPPKSQGFRKQWEAVLPLCDAAGYSYYRKDDGFEADDVIGTLAHTYKDVADVFVYSNDKDFAQLVDKHVTLLQPKKFGGLSVLGIPEVTKKYGGPEMVTTYLSLVGDTSDNVPGVPGVGPGWALKYITAHGDWQGIYNNIDAIKGKKKESLIASESIVKQAIELVTIVIDMELEFEGCHALNQMVKSKHDNDALYALSVRYGLKNLHKFYDLKPPHHPTMKSVKYIDSVEQWMENRSHLEGVESVVLFPLFSNMDVSERQLLGLGVSISSEHLFNIDFGSGGTGPKAGQSLFEAYGDEEESYNQELLELVWGDLFSGRTWITHDAKQLYSFAMNNQLPLAQGGFVDVMLKDYLDSRFINHRTHTLEDIAQRLAHFEIDLSNPDTTKSDNERILIESCSTIWSVLDKFELTSEMETVLQDIEMACVPAIAGMEVAGIRVNVDQFAQFASDIQVKLTAISSFIEEEVGHAVNVNSPKQVSTLLYKERGLTPSKKTKSGGSTDSTSLQLLLEQTDDPVIPKILEYREIGKIKSTYLDALPTFVRTDGRIHTHLHQTVTATGRLSSSSPNLQNIPVRKAWGKVIRQCFVASEGRVLISADYSQIEMRVLAHLCGEGVLVDTFNAGEDVHTRTAKDIAEEGVELTPELRNIAKAINYGLIYGMSSYRLARELAISRDEASTYMKRYFERYPEIKDVLDGLIEDARNNGYAQTIFGRQRPIYNLDSIDKNQREAAERIALNAPVQGAAADIMKIAMCKVAQVLTQKHPTATLLLQVHDELVLECYPNEAEDIVRLLKEEMTNVAQLSVPLVVDVMIGDTWGDIH